MFPIGNSGHVSVTSKADIYSFGLTIYEMIGLKPPHIPTVDDDDESSLDGSMAQETNDTFFDRAIAESLGK